MPGTRARTSAERIADTRPTRSRVSGMICGLARMTLTWGVCGAEAVGVGEQPAASAPANARPRTGSDAVRRGRMGWSQFQMIATGMLPCGSAFYAIAGA